MRACLCACVRACVPPDTKGLEDAQQTAKPVLTVQCGGGSERRELLLLLHFLPCGRFQVALELFICIIYIQVYVSKETMPSKHERPLPHRGLGVAVLTVYLSHVTECCLLATSNAQTAQRTRHLCRGPRRTQWGRDPHCAPYAVCLLHPGASQGLYFSL